jgi:nesprin-1
MGELSEINLLYFFQSLFNMLQAEKSRLVTAIQACEAATASVSRPGSPMTDQETTYSEKELNVKAKLEDLIDQVAKDNNDLFLS